MLTKKYGFCLIYIAGLVSGILLILLISYIKNTDTSKENPKESINENIKESLNENIKEIIKDSNLIENIKNNKSSFEYSIDTDLLRTYSKYSPDTLYLYKYIHEYIQYSDPSNSKDLYIPQSTILTDILLSTNVPKGYTSIFFKLGYKKIYTILCTFYKEISDQNILKIITDTNYSFSTKDKIDYDTSIIFDRYTNMELYTDRVFEVQQFSNFMYYLYYPIDVYKVLNYKYNMKKEYTFDHYLLKEMDDIILVRDGKDTRVSILDYILISYQLSN